MSIPSLIFWAIFVLPLVAFLVWIMRQDKKKGVTGLIVLAVIVIGAIVYTIIKKDGMQG
jgi:K+ transporter